MLDHDNHHIDAFSHTRSLPFNVEWLYYFVTQESMTSDLHVQIRWISKIWILLLMLSAWVARVLSVGGGLMESMLWLLVVIFIGHHFYNLLHIMVRPLMFNFVYFAWNIISSDLFFDLCTFKFYINFSIFWWLLSHKNVPKVLKRKNLSLWS